MLLQAANRSKKPLSRPALQCEALEERQLMAGNVWGSFPTGPVATWEKLPPAHFTSFTASDASGDDTPATIFTGGAVRVGYEIQLDISVMLAPQKGPGGNETPPLPPPPPPSPLHYVAIELWQGGNLVAESGFFNQMSVQGGLINLNGLSVAGGELELRARAYFLDGTKDVSAAQILTAKTPQVILGDFTAGTFDLSAYPGDAIVLHGRGGTDRLKLNALDKTVASFNGGTLSQLPFSTPGAAIYQGMAVDYLRLANGKEVYMTGIEQLEVLQEPAKTQALLKKPKKAKAKNKGLVTAPPQEKVIQLMVRPNDELFAGQWGLHTTDVPDAWRFTKGSDKILLVSLDTGVLPNDEPLGGGAITGIDTARLITDASDVDDAKSLAENYGHGHQSISLMAASANDKSQIAGINWVSSVMVVDVRVDSSREQGIRDAMAYAEARGLKVVFQNGSHGQDFSTELADLVKKYSTTTLFSISAGNGGPGGNVKDPNYLTSVKGWGKLATTHDNVMSVGAVMPGPVMAAQDTDGAGTADFGLSNATNVQIAAYSNRGPNLSLVAPTDVVAINHFGGALFGGTSASNPQVAGIASLVWGANPKLQAWEVRRILTTTTMDLGDPGADSTYGAGLIDAGLAVRKAVAMARDHALATLGSEPLDGSQSTPFTATSKILKDIDSLPKLHQITPAPVTPLEQAFAAGAGETLEFVPARFLTTDAVHGAPAPAAVRLQDRLAAHGQRSVEYKVASAVSDLATTKDWASILATALRNAFAADVG